MYACGLDDVHVGFSDDELLMNAYTFFQTHALVEKNARISQITSRTVVFHFHTPMCVS